MSGTVDSQRNQLMTEIVGSSCDKDSDNTGTSNRVHTQSRYTIGKRTHDVSVSNCDSSKMLVKSELSQPEHFSSNEQQTFVKSLPLVNADVNKSLTLSNSRCSVGAGSEMIDGGDRHEEKSRRPGDGHDSSTALLQQREEHIDLYGDPLHLGNGDNGIEGHSGGSLKDYAIDALVNDHFADPGRKVEQLSRFTDKDTSVDLHRDILNDACRESGIVSAVPLNPISSPEHHSADNSNLSSTQPFVQSPLPSLDLYTEIVCDDVVQQDLSNHEMRRCFSEAQDYIRFLHEKLDTVESSSEKLVQENTVLKKNMSALLLTSQTELQRKASQIESLRTLNNPAIVNALAKLRNNRNYENPLSGTSDHLSSLISDASNAYSQLYGESSTSQVLSNTDTDKSRRMVSSGDSKASRDADKREILKKRKYEEDNRDELKKLKVSPSVSARGRTAKRNVDKYPSSSDPSNKQMEKHHTRNDDPGDKTLDSCSRVDKHSLDNNTKEEKNALGNNKRKKDEKEKGANKDEKEKSVRSGKKEKCIRKVEKEKSARKGEKEKSVKNDHIYEMEKKTISTSKTDHSTVEATEKYDQKERNDKRRKGEMEKSVRKNHIYERDKNTRSTSKTDHSTIRATEKYDWRERNDNRRKGEQENSATKDHIYERNKNTRGTSKTDNSTIRATEKYKWRERNSHSDKIQHKRLNPRSHQSSTSSKGVYTENTDLGNGASHSTPISQKRAFLEDDVELKNSISLSDKEICAEPGQHGMKTRDSPIHLTRGLPNLVSMECHDHRIIPISSPVLQQVVDMESGVANVEQHNCSDSSQGKPNIIDKQADDLGSTSHAPLISQKPDILGHNPSPNDMCRDGDNKRNSSRVLAKSIDLQHVQHVKQVYEKPLNVKGDVKAVKQRNRASNLPLTSLKRKRVTYCDTTTKQSDKVILEGGDHIDEVNHFLISPKKICMQYTTVYSPSSNNNENKALKELSSAAETDETTNYFEGTKYLETDEITYHGNGAKCLETDEANAHGNGAKWFETNQINDHGNGAKWFETDQINDHGNGAKCNDIGNPDSNKNESAVANMESNMLKLDLEHIKQNDTASSAVLSSGNDAESQGGNALDKEQPYVLHKIENIPQEIKSWKSRLEKFKNSNYSLCETWEYLFFSNVSAHKSVHFNTFENTSVNTSTSQSKQHALGVNEKSSESYHLTSNEKAILSQTFSAGCDKGSEASDLAVLVDDAESQIDALNTAQPYVLHKIENIPQEIKSWKSRLEKFKNSNYRLCETWEYPFFSNVLAHKSVSFNTFENTSVSTPTPQSKPHALGVNEKSSESYHLTSNENAILSQSLSAECDKGAEASGLAVPVDYDAECDKGSKASDLPVRVDDAESQGDALDKEYPYVLHKIENIPLEIKSWKSRLEKFKKSNYSLCETWEYPFFSNESAILSQTFSVECDKGSGASGIAIPVDANNVTQNVDIQNHSDFFKLDHSQQTANQSGDMCDPTQMTIPNVSAISDSKIKHIEQYLPDCEASCRSNDAYCLDSNCGSGLGCVKMAEKQFPFKSNSSVANVNDNVDGDVISDCVVENSNIDIDADESLPLKDTVKKSLLPARYFNCDDSRSSMSNDLHVIQVYLDDSESCDCVYTQDSSVTLSKMMKNSFENGTCKLFDKDTLPDNNASDKSNILTDNDECCNSFTVDNSRCDNSVEFSVEDTGSKSSVNTAHQQLDVSTNGNEKPGSFTCDESVVIAGEEAITEFTESPYEIVTFLEGCARTRLYIKCLKSNDTVNIQTSVNSLETGIAEDLNTHSHNIKMCIPGKQSVCEARLSFDTDSSRLPVTKNNMLNTTDVQIHCEKNTINLEENKDSHNVVQGYAHHNDKQNREVPQQTSDYQNLIDQKTNSEMKDMVITISSESSDDSDSSDSFDEESSSSDEESSSSSSDEESSSSSSDEESSSSDDTSSDSDSDVGERNSVYPASSGIRNKSQQTVDGSGNSNVLKLFDRLKPLNELFSRMLSNQNRRTKASEPSASNTKTGKGNDSKAKDTTAKIVSDKMVAVSDKDNLVCKVSKTSNSNTQSGKAKYSKPKDTTAKVVSDKSDTINDKGNPVYSEDSIKYSCISLDAEDCSLQLHMNNDEEISEDSSLEDGELRSESPDDYIVTKHLTERKLNFEPHIKLKTSNILSSASGQQRGHRRGTKLSMDLYRPVTGESQSSNQGTKAFSTLKGYKIPRKRSLGSQKRPFSDVGTIDRTPKRKRLEKSSSQSVSL